MFFLYFTAPTTKCVDGQGIDSNGDCVPCNANEGRTVDDRGRCVCDWDKGYTPRGNTCVAIGCRTDDQCDEQSRCINGACVHACEAEPCGQHTTCDVIGHRSHCACIPGYIGNPRVQCYNATTTQDNYRTDFPLPDMQVQLKNSCIINDLRALQQKR